MKNALETDDIIYKALKADTELTAMITGDIYVTERADESELEDIVVNNIALTREMPQSATSNVNIHVPDIKVRINGQDQWVANRERLKTLTDKVVNVLENASVTGLIFHVSSENIIKETALNDHYNNLRLEWTIATI